MHARPFTLRGFKIEVTYTCNLNCAHCSSDARPSNPISLDEAACIRILNEASTMGTNDVALSGGEPLLWAPLPNVVKVAHAHGLAVTIYTSGVVDGFQQRAALLKAAGAGRFVFSVFGGTQTSHERVTRTAGSFERTKAAIREAAGIGLSVEVHFVPMSTNYRELEAVAGLARHLGALRVSVLRLVPQGRASLLSGRVLNRAQNLDLRTRIVALRGAGHDIRTGSPYNFLMINDKPGCWAGIDRLIIGPDLSVYPCDAFKRIGARELVGTDKLSWLSDDTLADCWESSPYLEGVRTYLTTPFSPPCDGCEDLPNCLSGCLAQKAIKNGTLTKCPDPDCIGKGGAPS